MKQGFQSVVTGGHLDAKGLAMSFVQRASGKLMGSIFDDIFGGIFGSANGNVIKGGFQAFAKGGLVTKPTLGLVGEGKYNEAVVPLPDGRSIPISGATGNTENNVTVNVTIDSDGNAKSDTNSGMDGDRAKQLGYMVSQAVQAELVDQKRPGGLLSQY
jgi:phage-related minor tail protein